MDFGLGLICRLLRREDGAVTLDWVALTATVLLVGIAVVYAIYENGVLTVVDATNAALSPGVTETDLDLTPDF